MEKTHCFPVRVWHFYIDGFRHMTWGKTLWIIVLVKLFLIFGVLRAFFFHPALAGKTTEEKQQTVAEELIQREGGERTFDKEVLGE